MNLHSKCVPSAELSTEFLDRMYELFAASYDCVVKPRFLEDLSWKDEVILIFDRDELIQGFTTLAFNPKGFWHSEGDVLFSGDTIIDPAYWGSNELVQAFCRRAGEWQSVNGRRLFWMLISKGHRTYLFLPLFAKRFFPHPERKESALEEIADMAASRLFGNEWNRECGIVHFEESMGHLKGELAAASWQRSRRPMVRYFLERNPGFENGDELVCIAELSLENLKRSALRCFVEGMVSHV